jgi:hypothetical protein
MDNLHEGMDMQTVRANIVSMPLESLLTQLLFAVYGHLHVSNHRSRFDLVYSY